MDIGELELCIPTVSEINKQIVEFTKDYVKKKVSEILNELASDEGLPRDRLMMYVRKINFDDITATVSATKKPRKKVDSKDQCKAKTCKGDQCSRTRKDDLDYCGSHETSRPHGEIEAPGDTEPAPSRSRPIIKIKY